MRHLAYCTLFRTLAERHQLIRHTVATPRFARIVVSLDPIQRLLDLQEFTSVLATRLKPGGGTHAMVLETCNTQYRDNGGDHRNRQRHGAFLILTKCGKEPDDISAALDSCEIVGENILAAVLHEFADDPRTRFAVGDFTSDAVGPLGDGTWYGVRFDFEYTTPANAALTYDPAAFN